MRTAYRLIILFGVGLFLSLLLPFTIGPNLFLTFLQTTVALICFFGLVFAAVATLIIGFFSWRKPSRLWMCPALLCLALILSFLVCSKFGVWADVDTWWFKQRMTPYVKIVDSIQSGVIPCSPTIAGIDITNLPSGISGVAAARCSDGSVLVEFYGTGSSFAGNMGYLFKNYTETNNCIADNIKPEKVKHLHHIIDNWYKFSD
jgi:hypothetical protein